MIDPVGAQCGGSAISAWDAFAAGDEADAIGTSQFVAETSVQVRPQPEQVYPADGVDEVSGSEKAWRIFEDSQHRAEELRSQLAEYQTAIREDKEFAKSCEGCPICGLGESMCTCFSFLQRA